MRLSAILRPHCYRHRQYGGYLRSAYYKHAAVGHYAPGALIRYNSTATATTTKTSTNYSIADTLEQGHISVGPDEELLFINNILPLRLQWLYRLLWIGDSHAVDQVLKRVDKPSYAAADHWAIVKRALPPDLHIDVKQVIPRLSEGGLFIKYSLSDGEKRTKGEIAAAVDEYLKTHPIRPWFNPLDRVGVGRVLGKPWIEDMYHFPSPKLKVEFLPSSSNTTPAELTPEALYSLFRRYGKIKDIERQPPDSKVLPKYAIVEFTRAKYAILARSCTHGVSIPETVSGDGVGGSVLRITYERKIKAHWIREWLFNHPRIVIPAVAALIAGITVIIFDPIRTFFIKVKVKYLLNADDQPLWSWIRKEVRKANILSFKRGNEKNVLRALSDDRKEDISQLQSWIGENGNTFIVVQGPHGSGKREIVLDQALKDRKHKLVIDCKQIQDARGDAATISVAAQQVGYRPIFSWMNSFSSFIDLASQGIIGTKAGFSETLDSQLSKIWTNTATALRQIALENKKKENNGMSDDDYLEAHPEKRPVVVIDNFLHGGHESNIVDDKLAEWAAALVTGNIAHVIFLTPDASYTKTLSKAMPNQVFRSVSLGDCSLEVGRNFILRYLQNHEEDGDGDDASPPEKKTPPQGLEDLDRCIEIVGGRLTDLEFMAHRIKSGESPKSAVKHIIEQAATEIVKTYVLEDNATSNDSLTWTREQAWYLIKSIGEDRKGAVPYSSIILSDLFSGSDGEKTLAALEQRELITVVNVHGRPATIKPGRPIYHAAFKYLTQDEILRHRLDLGIVRELINKENQKIAKYESELQLFRDLSKYPSNLEWRMRWVAGRLLDSHWKVEKYERQSRDLAKFLKTAE